MLDFRPHIVPSMDGNGGPVEIVMKRNASEVEDGGRQICVGGGLVNGDISIHVRTTDKEGHTDILLPRTSLSRSKPVLTDMVAIVRCVDNIGVVEQA